MLSFCLPFLPNTIGRLILVGLLLNLAAGILTQGATVTADTLYNQGNPGFDLCAWGLVDGKWPWTGYNPSTHCCAHTDPKTGPTWFSINMGAQTVVYTVLLINREDCCSSRIITSDLTVGDNALPVNNTPCGANPTSSGVYSCGGKIGQYLGVYKAKVEILNISQIRAYPYEANAYTNFQYLTSPIGTCPTSSNLVFTNGAFSVQVCKMPVDGNPAYYNVVFDVPRYVQVVTLVGNSYSSFVESKNWFVTVGSGTGTSITANTLYGQYLTANFDMQGKEIKVGAYGQSVGIYRQDGVRLSFRWVAIFTTASDCSGPFDWSGSRLSWRIALNTQAQTVTGLLVAKIDDCAVFHSKLVLVDGSALPSIMTYNVYTKLLTVSIAATQTPVSYTVNACANLNDKVTTAKSECKPIVIEIFYATSIGWGTANFYYEMEQLGQQVVFDLPTTVWTPADANTIISYSVVGAPSFLSFQTTSNPVQGVISTSATTGTFNYQVIVQDSISGLTTTLNATLFVYNCIPTGFLLSPGSLTVRISGPGLKSAWSYTPLFSACGNYSISFDASFAYLLTVSGQNIIAQAPQTALGTFNPVITLSRDSNAVYSTTATLTVTILAPLMTSLSFNLVASATSFKYEIELTSNQMLFDFPAIVWAPIDAEKVISFELIGAPGFLTLKQTDTKVQGVLTSAITGTFNYQVKVNDSVSALTAQLEASLFIYSCEPVGFALTPSSVSVSILGKSEALTWSMSQNYQACGSYSVTIEQAFASVISVNGQQLTAQALATASSGTFTPIITLKRDANPTQQVTGSLALAITSCMVTSLSFSKQPTSQVTIDLATYSDPITVPFDTKQTPQCNNEVAFALVPSSLTFLSLST